MSTEHDNTFTAYSLGIQRTLRLNDLIHFFLSALTSPAGGNFSAAILSLYNKRSHALQGMLGITQETSLFALPANTNPEFWCHPRVTTEIQRRQRDADFNRAAMRLRFQLVGTPAIATVCKEGISHSLLGNEAKDELAALFRHFCSSREYACLPLCGREGLIGVVIFTDNTGSLPAPRLAEAEAYVRHA
jgi:hypothetical protein